MYQGWSTLWPGLAKNLVDTLGGPAATVATAGIGPVLAWSAVILPLVDAWSCAHGVTAGCAALALALPATGAAFGLHIAGALFFKIPLWYGLLFPFGYSAGALLAADGLFRRATGRVSWKGRTYR
jgi:chlorobactene glucosyltransferase